MNLGIVALYASMDRSWKTASPMDVGSPCSENNRYSGSKCRIKEESLQDPRALSKHSIVGSCCRTKQINTLIIKIIKVYNHIISHSYCV